MALPLPPGLTPSEIAFVAEMELVTVVARQRLDSLSLFSVRSPCFRRIPPALLPTNAEPLPLLQALPPLVRPLFVH